MREFEKLSRMNACVRDVIVCGKLIGKCKRDDQLTHGE